MDHHETGRGKPVRANCICTYTGKLFEPADPDPELIDIRDIAHALSLICRGNGHVSTFWSVGQHCLCCAKEAKARGLSDRMALACLLHDASECYLSDIPRPFKKDLPEYRETEEAYLDMIYGKFIGSTLTPEEEKQLKQIDDDLLWYDLKLLLHGTQEGEEPRMEITPDYSERPFADVEREYLQLFEELSEKLSEKVR